MKFNYLLLMGLLFILTNCVQKSALKTVVVKLHVNGFHQIESVGIRGSDQPLSWDYDLALQPVFQDSIYTVTFSMLTGYRFTEAKFVVNGQFELANKDNRKITFSERDTTVYEATFNQVSK